MPKTLSHYHPGPNPLSILFLSVAIRTFASTPLRLDRTILCRLRILAAVLELASLPQLALAAASEPPPSLLALSKASGLNNSPCGLVGATTESGLATSLPMRRWPWKILALHACTRLKVARCSGGEVRVAASCSKDAQGAHWDGTMESESGVLGQGLSARAWRREGVSGVGEGGGRWGDRGVWWVLLVFD